MRAANPPGGDDAQSRQQLSGSRRKRTQQKRRVVKGSALSTRAVEVGFQPHSLGRKQTKLPARRGRSEFVTHAGGTGGYLCRGNSARRLRPARRRLAITLRPPFDFRRERNPHLRMRLTLCGR